MLEQLTPELRHELATIRVAGLRHSADHTPLVFDPREVSKNDQASGTRAEARWNGRSGQTYVRGRSTTILELTPEFRHEAAVSRMAALHRSAEPVPAGPVRRRVGSALVRLGLRLGYDGSVPPFVSQLETEEGTPAPAGGTSWSVVRAA